MGLALPLSVRLKTGSADRHVTRDLRDLTFRSTAPGGFASATFSLDRPLDTQPTDVDYYASVYVYDRRSGAVVWEGMIEDPGRTATDGEVWQVTAVGGAARTQDVTRPLIYIDQSISDGWVRADNDSAPGCTVQVAADPGLSNDRTQAIVVTLPGGVNLSTDDRGVWRYVRIADAGQKLARVKFDWDSNSSANFHVQAVARGGGTTLFYDVAFNNAGGSPSAFEIVADWAAGRDTLDLRGKYVGAGAMPTITNWCSFRNVTVVATRFEKDGTEFLTATDYSNNTVLASEVVRDILGRGLLPKFDGANATVAATTTTIDSLAYPEGVTPNQLLADLMEIEPGYFWAAWESNSSGLYRFEWKAWPTSVRYEATVYDGFDSPGSAVDLYNKVRVRYINPDGNLATEQRTQTVTALDNAGLSREGLVDLTDRRGRTSLTTAQRVGDQWLANRAVPPNAGTLTVARPILDLTAGAMVQPWEIKPGNLIRVRGVLPRIDALNPTARDGVTVFRVSAVEFNAASASAQLELDTYPRSTARALALAARRR